MKLGTRVVMGVPTLRSNPRTPAWIDAMAGLQMPLGSSLGRAWMHDAPIAEARNALAKQALEQGAEWLFFLGDDVLPPANALLMLLDKAGREYPDDRGRMVRADMVTGVYWTKSYPPEPYLWQGLLKGSHREWKAGEFFPVDLAGCDCLLISADVLRGVPEPWFSTEWAWEAGQRPSSIATEDFYFFTKARKHGYRLFADTAVQCMHEDRATGYLFGIEDDMPQARGVLDLGEAETLVAELGAGMEAAWWGSNARVMRFDIRPELRPDVRCDLRAIPEQLFGKFDVVHARHVLEHFGRYEVQALVAHWARLLKPGGKLVIRVPNVAHAMRRLLAGERHHYDWAQLYGGQRYEHDFHRSGFDARSLGALLRSVPALGGVEVTEEQDGLNLCGAAVLKREPVPEVLADWWEEIAAQEAGPAAPDAGPAEPAGGALLPPAALTKHLQEAPDCPDAGHGHVRPVTTNGVMPAPDECSICTHPKGVDGDQLEHRDGIGRPICGLCSRTQLCDGCRMPALAFRWAMDDGKFCSWECLPAHWKNENGENGTAAGASPREILA
jgi:SAM-dependent methyltransferase